MHSGAVEKAGSPRKRVLSRGMSEEETLRHIIKEAEESNKRTLSRSDSRYGSLKRGETRESLSEEEHAGNPGMLELQANYEDSLQELQTLELRQEVLLFQVDCLQDALQGAEEMLAETQRESQEAHMELERERERRRKLEDSVARLVQEVERLKEENSSLSAELVRSTAETVGAEGNLADAVDGGVPNSTPSSDGVSQSSASTFASSEQKMLGILTSLFKNRRLEPSLLKPAGPQSSSGGSSVDQEVKEPEKPAELRAESGLEGGVSQKALDGEENDESSGYEDAPSEFSPASTPEGCAGLLEDEVVTEDGEPSNSDDPIFQKNPGDSCILS
ncbi:leucine-rich repeat flightless-interacting protein 1 [Astyanax mexicanus]|uniref:leucine-rich repeat flightless-interacting protein 1 n=1 Tax=Astyanax mexicanus TaxID=7994 RepID=UPI0020CB53A6|nr:leucine-rich repeat flightless-interacting protein 1 [Astyanax mexicanus]